MPDAMEIHTIHAKNRERKQNNNNYDRRFNGILEFPAFLQFQINLVWKLPFIKKTKSATFHWSEVSFFPLKG